MTGKTGHGWPVWKIWLVLYPFAIGAAAVNIFFFGLMIQAIGFSAFSPVASLIAGVFFGAPFGWFFARHTRKLLDRAAEG